LKRLFVLVPVAAHLLRVVDPATGQTLEANKLKAEVAAFMAAGEPRTHSLIFVLEASCD
jgi:hypothetical protein